MLFHNDQVYLLELLVKTIEALTGSARSTAPKLLLVTNKHIGPYMNFYESQMPPTTQRATILDRESTTMTSPNSINVVPKNYLFRYPIVSTSPIIAAFKDSCQQFMPIKNSGGSSTLYLKKTPREHFYQIVCNGRFTGRDYDGTKYNGWFGPKLIDLYLSWFCLPTKFTTNFWMVP